MDNTDKSLIDAHCQGDTTAFEQLLRRHGPSVLGYLIKMTGSREKAEDFFQETFKRVHEKAHTIRGNHFKPWLFRVATNVAIDGSRGSGRLPVVSLNQKVSGSSENEQEVGAVALVDNSHNPADQVVKAEQKKQVRRAIDLLPKRQRATLILAYYQQLSYPEVAQAMGCSTGTVKTQMYRALKTLARKLPFVTGGTK